MRTRDKSRRLLRPHDGASEVFVCRDCGEEIDPVGGNYPGWTDQECEDGVCPLCSSEDTRWMYAEGTDP